MDKTLELTIGEGKTVKVEELPKSMRDLVDFFDDLREDLMKNTYEGNKIRMAMAAVQSQLMADVTAYVDAVEKQQQQMTENMNEEVENENTNDESPVKRTRPSKKTGSKK